jgi:hypothetical protein
MKVNVGVEPGLLSICPTPSPPGPFIKVARSQGSGGIRYRLQYRYTTRTRISTNITIGPSLTGIRGTQLTGSIIYTLVKSSHEPDGTLYFSCFKILALWLSYVELLCLQVVSWKLAQPCRHGVSFQHCTIFHLS